MKNYFHQVKRFIIETYPEVDWNITGENYPPPEFSQFIASLASFIWLFGIVFLFCGEHIIKSIGLSQNHLLKVMYENKMTCFIILFMINNYGASMLATGAFEVYLDNEIIYSKLKQHKLPTAEILLEIFNALGFHIPLDNSGSE